MDLWPTLFKSICVIFYIPRIKGAFLFGMGEEPEGEENVGTTTLTTTENGLFKLKWDQTPFDSPIGIDQNFSTLQAVLTTPLYEKELTQETDDDESKGLDDGTLKPKNFSVLKLQEFGSMESGQVDFPQGPLKLRLRWSPEMIAASSIYALLKIQNNHQQIKEPGINQIKKILYSIDNPSYVFKKSIRTSQTFAWVLQQSKALSHAFWYYRRSPKYAPDISFQSYAEYRALRASLGRFLGDQGAQDIATDLIELFKSHRYPMDPIHLLQAIKARVLKALKNSGDILDVLRYECTINPGSTGANLGNSNFKMSCIKEAIENTS